jgi:hypothetical protein
MGPGSSGDYAAFAGLLRCANSGAIRGEPDSSRISPDKPALHASDHARLLVSHVEQARDPAIHNKVGTARACA